MPTLSVDRYLAPTSLVQALAALADDGGATVLAGGTDLMPQSRAGKVRPARTLLNIRRVPGLDAIAVDADDGALSIGSLVTLTALRCHELVRRHAPLVAEAVDHFASDQIRNAATLGGNLCNASPAGDLAPPLLALDAEVELASLGDAGAVRRRRVALAEFFTGPGRSVRAPGELLCAVRLPRPPAGLIARYYKGGTRPALDISPIAIAIALTRDAATGRVSHVRVALGAVAPTPLRARRTEALLEDRVLDDALAEEAAQCAAGEAQPIDDVRASAWYRRELVHNLMKRMLDDVAHH